MGIFGPGKKTLSEAPVVETTEPVEEPVNEYPQKLETMAIEASVEEVLKVNELWEVCVKEELAMHAGFSFSCKRHGDFLAIFLTQTAGFSPDRGVYPLDVPRKYAATLNLSKVVSIRFKEGHPTDRNGEGWWDYSLENLDKARFGFFRSSSNMGYADPGPDSHYVLRFVWEFPVGLRPLHGKGEDEQIRNEMIRERYGYFTDPRSYRIKHTIPSYPRSYKSDAIIFDGLDFSIYAPPGRGKEVLDAIHTELRKGAPKELRLPTHLTY